MLTILDILVGSITIKVYKSCFSKVYTAIFHIPAYIVIIYKSCITEIYLTVTYSPPVSVIIYQLVVLVSILIFRGINLSIFYVPPCIFTIDGSLNQSGNIRTHSAVFHIIISIRTAVTVRNILIPSVIREIYPAILHIPGIQWISLLVMSVSDSGIGKINHPIVTNIPPAAIVRIHLHFIIVCHSSPESVPVCLSIYV